MSRSICRLIITAALAVAAASPATRAGTVSLTPDQTADQIRRALRSVSAGDTVTVSPGGYGELRVPSGIVLQSETGPSETVFSGGGEFVLDLRGADSTTVIDGLTLDGGRAARALIRADSSAAVIRNCVLRGGWSGIRAAGSQLRIENCLVTDCQNGIFLDQGAGRLVGNEIQRCSRGVNLVDASPVLHANEIRMNSVGLATAGRSAPEVGGSPEHANRFRENRTAVRNTAASRAGALGKRRPIVLRAPKNYWGTECPGPADFLGPVEYRPWMTEDGSQSLEECPPAASDGR